MITRQDPFHEALSLRRVMDQLFEQSFVRPGLTPVSPSLMVPMDICETPNGYEVDVALPGVGPEDIELVVDQNALTIRGHFTHQDEHQSQSQSQTQSEQSQQQSQAQTGQPQQQSQAQTGQPQQQSQAQTGQPQQGSKQRHREGHNWLLQEIPSGTFERTITFPRPVDPDKIQTKYENGILTLLVPVSEASRPKRFHITASQGQQQAPVGAGRS